MSGNWDPGWAIYPVNWNADGLSDFFLYKQSTGTWTRVTNDGARGWSYIYGHWTPRFEIYPGDFDGDGRSDIFLYDPSAGDWFIAISTGTDFTYGHGFWSSGWTVKVADLDGNGRNFPACRHVARVSSKSCGAGRPSEQNLSEILTQA